MKTSNRARRNSGKKAAIAQSPTTTENPSGKSGEAQSVNVPQGTNALVWFFAGDSTIASPVLGSADRHSLPDVDEKTWPDKFIGTIAGFGGANWSPEGKELRGAEVKKYIAPHEDELVFKAGRLALKTIPKPSVGWLKIQCSTADKLLFACELWVRIRVRDSEVVCTVKDDDLNYLFIAGPLKGGTR